MRIATDDLDIANPNDGITLPTNLNENGTIGLGSAV